MKQRELTILHSDKQYAINRIGELDEEIQQLGPEFYDVFNQSSETWHDNAPFEALRDRQSVLDAERQNLKRILQDSSTPSLKLRRNIVDMGCVAELVNRDNKVSRFFIAGDWTPFAGSKKHNATVISRLAPIAQEIVGRKADYEFSFRGIGYKIQAIEYPGAE